MENDQEMMELIEGWFEKRLSQEQVIEFNRLNSTNLRFAEMVARYRMATEAIHLLKQKSIEEKIGSWNATIDTLPDSVDKIKPFNHGNQNLNWFLFALLLILLFYNIYEFRQGSYQPELNKQSLPDSVIAPYELRRDTNTILDSSLRSKSINFDLIAQTNIKDFDQPSISRGPDESDSSLNKLNMVLSFYLEKKYDLTIQDIQKLNTENVDAQYILGMAYFRIKSYTKAEQIFQQILLSGKIAPDHLEWNILLCKIALYKTTKSSYEKLFFKILSDKDHTYYEKAQKLSGQLNIK